MDTCKWPNEECKITVLLDLSELLENTDHETKPRKGHATK